MLLGLLVWRWTRRTEPLVESRRLAVLPFENLGDSADAYFADGVTDEIRGKLAAVPGLEVVASLSSNGYRGSTWGCRRSPGTGRGLPPDREDPLAAAAGVGRELRG